MSYKKYDILLGLTGVDNHLILANLDLLYRKGASIRLRCPLVPGVNDNPAHLAAIAALNRRYPRLAGIDLLPTTTSPVPSICATTSPTCQLPLPSRGKPG